MNKRIRPKWANNWRGWAVAPGREDSMITGVMTEDGRIAVLFITRLVIPDADPNPGTFFFVHGFKDEVYEKYDCLYPLTLVTYSEDANVLRRIADAVIREIGATRTP